MKKLEITIPGMGHFELEHLLLDLNGTLSTRGEIIAGIQPRLQKLRKNLSIQMITADTRGTGQQIADTLGIDLYPLEQGGQQTEAEQKAKLVQSLEKQTVVSIGNGNNDRLMLNESAISIAVIGQEGLATSILSTAQVVVTSILDALDLLLFPASLIATLRN